MHKTKANADKKQNGVSVKKPKDYLYIDIETRSGTDIGRGLHNYMHDERFEIILVSWALNDNPPSVFEPKNGIPAALISCLNDPNVKLVAHNSNFEIMAFNITNIFGRQFSPHRFEDTMIQALAHGLPPSLKNLCGVFNLSEEQGGKIEAGSGLIKLLTKPNAQDAFYTEVQKPLEWEEFKYYAINDITSMRYLHKIMPRVNYPVQEFDLWCLDQKINNRGIPVDVDFVNAAIETAKRERVRLNSQVREQTDGEVDKATKRDALLDYLLKEHDIFMPDLRASTLERRMADVEIPRGGR